MNKVFIFFIIYSLHYNLPAQILDSLPNPERPSTRIPRSDSLVIRNGALYLVSPDSIDVPVDYGADDRVRFDYKERVIHLYKNAFIHYKTMDIRADYIRIELNTNLAIALPQTDSSGNLTGVPQFKETDQSFKAKKITYNFKSKKGLIEEVVTHEEDLYIHGSQTKFISKQSSGSQGDDIIYNKHALITTCDAEKPHFGIASTRQKIIPNKLVVVGPSNIEIEGIPTPIWLPFGFFPISRDAQSGILFPKEYQYDDRGFGLAGIGYYLPLNDHVDLKFLTDIFFKGSFKINVSGNYKWRYRYNGNFSLQFENRIQEISGDYKKNINRPISLRWSHNQEAGAHPYQTFGGSMNIETKGFSKTVYSDTRQSLQNVLRSNFNYGYTFPNSPFSLSAAMSHSQNLITHELNLTLPELNVQMRTINPFKNKNRISQSEKWYDRINLSYGAQFQNTLNTTDTSIFQKGFEKDLVYGIKHRADINATFKVLKYFNLTPSINYNEEFFFHKQEKILLDTILKDTLGIDSLFGLTQTKYKSGFYPFRTFSTGASLGTQIFGQIQSSKSWFRGIRHQVTPTISMSYAPDYHKNPFNYFKQVDSDLRDSFNRRYEYLIYGKSPFGTSSVPSENFNINFNIGNRVELKYYSKKDSTAKKIALLEGFNFSANYNVFADSFKLSLISGSGSSRIFKGYTTLYYGITMDPYGRTLLNGNEIRSQSYALNLNKKLVYLTSSFININTNINIGQLIGLFNKEILNKKDNGQAALPELFYNFNIQHIINFRHTRLATGKDTFERTLHNITLTGSIALTNKWRININNISYNFDKKGIQYPSFGLERDLHCWLMKFDWSPQFGYYSFTLGVKPGSLEFIRLPSNQSFSGARR
ncbi:MAG: LPS-assembly protein LptD [Saprospiraceae bacterium]|nr:LPS-assembly protein LptD [Saprospiraceae bacterium]